MKSLSIDRQAAAVLVVGAVIAFLLPGLALARFESGILQLLAASPLFCAGFLFVLAVRCWRRNGDAEAAA